MRIRYRTNLDEAKNDVSELDAWNHQTSHMPVPRKGERIVFEFMNDRARPFQYELEVCAVAYNHAQGRVDVELHIPSYHSMMPLTEWVSWFKRHRYGNGE